MAYNPNEPRDDHGRWTSGATAAERFASAFYPDHPKPGPVGPIGPRGASPGGPSLTALSNAGNSTKDNVASWVKRFMGDTFSDDEISSIYDQLYCNIAWWKLPALIGVRYDSSGIVMSQDQYDIIAKAAAGLQLPELAARFQQAVTRAIQSGTLKISR